VLLAATLVVQLLRVALPGNLVGVLLAPGSPFSPVTLLLIAALYGSIWPSYRDVVRDDERLSAEPPDTSLPKG
jgi:hypothetical protein